MFLRFASVLTLASLFCISAAAQQSQPSQSTSGAQAAADQKSGTQGDDAKTANQDGDKDDATPAKHHTHVRLGTITVGAAYIHTPQSFFSPFYPYGFYPYGLFYPTLYSPFYDPFNPFFPYPPYGSLNYEQGKGNIRLSTATNLHNAGVYINDAYAGTADKLKDIWLDSGAYNLAVKAADGNSFEQRIYVLSGKTLKIKAELKAQKSDSPAEEKK